jgi:hypothetical protein
MTASIDAGATMNAALRYSVVLAVWDDEYEEYVSSDSRRDNWVDEYYFDSEESALKFLREHQIIAAYISDDEDMFKLVFP